MLLSNKDVLFSAHLHNISASQYITLIISLSFILDHQFMFIGHEDHRAHLYGLISLFRLCF